VNYRVLARKLRACGCDFERQAKGSHEMWRNPVTRKTALVPNWGRRDLKPGTISQIRRDLGIDKRDFDQA